MLGEEGDGKSWAVCDWIATQLSSKTFPPTLLVPSASMHESDIKEFLAETIKRQLGSRKDGFWSRRLEKWRKVITASHPNFLLFLDGLNEQPNFNFQHLISQVETDAWHGRVAIIATCRRWHWEEHFSALNDSCHTWLLEPYDDEELTSALEGHELLLKDIHANLLSLMRKPRYFDLVVRLREKLQEAGEVTVERLIYEDWRDRKSRKLNQENSISHGKFQEIISNVANEWRRQQRLTRKDIHCELDMYGNGVSLLDKLASENIISQSGLREWKVNKDHLVLGLGLLLADEVLSHEGADEREVEGAARSWLEPHADMDLKVAICGMAVVYALEKQQYPQDHRKGLFRAWIYGRNLEEDTLKDVVAYIPSHPELYTSLAEIVWSSKRNNSRIQDAFMSGFLRYGNLPGVHDQLIRAFEKWMGYIIPEGNLGRQAGGGDTELKEKGRRKVQALLGTVASSDIVKRYGYTLTFIDDPALLRLTATALAVISHMDRKPFLRALVASTLAGAAMGALMYDQQLFWVFRSAPDDIEQDLICEAENLLENPDRLAQTAAWWLLRGLGTEQCRKLASRIPEKFHFKNALASFNTENPCNGFNVWNYENYLDCLQRFKATGAPEVIAGRLRTVALSPSVSPPEDLSYILENVAKDLDLTQVRRVVHTSSEDNQLAEVELALCAFNPNRLAKIVNKLAHEAGQRSGKPLWLLVMKLYHYIPLLDEDALAVLENKWRTALRSEDEEMSSAESVLYPFALWGKSLARQLQIVDERGNKAEYYKSSPHFLSIHEQDDELELEQEFCSRLLEYGSDLSPNLLYYIVEQIRSPTRETVNLLISHFYQSRPKWRGFYCYIFAKSKSKEACDMLIDNDWKASGVENYFEKNWGSVLLAECAHELTFEELSERVSLSLLGYAVHCRVNKEDEIVAYGKLLDIALNMFKDRIDSLKSLPCTPIVYAADSGDDRPDYVWDLPTTSTGFSFMSFDSYWGGSVHKQPEAMRDYFNYDAQIEMINRNMKQCSEALEHEIDSGNPWFLYQLDEHALLQVAKHIPNLAEKWANTCIQLSRSHPSNVLFYRSFFENLCRALLDSNPKCGVELFYVLRALEGGNNIDENTGIESLLLFPFQVDEVEEVETLCKNIFYSCTTNLEIFDAVYAAESNGKVDFLISLVKDFSDSDRVHRKAMAVSILAFMDFQPNCCNIENIISELGDCWLKDYAIGMKQVQTRNICSKHWYTQYLALDDDVKAWAAFRLFLHCVDRRFWLWRAKIHKKHLPPPSRELFLKMSHREIQKFSLKNERNNLKLHETFFYSKVFRDQLHPWMQKYHD